jgi:hypothetical protein
MINRLVEASALALGELLACLAKPDCLALATDIHATMPREIRDRIYFFLRLSTVDWEGDLYDRHYPFANPTGYCEYRRKDVHLLKATYSWLSPCIVGHDFARECAQIHYEETTLVLHKSNFPHIKDLLETDLSGVDIRPADHIRHVQVHLNARDLHHPVDKGGLDGLGTLKQAAATVDFIISMRFCSGGVRALCTLVQYSKVFYPLMLDLKERKIHSRVRMDYHSDCQRDITSLWQNTAGTASNGLDDHRVTANRFKTWDTAICKLHTND